MNELPPGPFGCILADPPWRFVSYDGEDRVPTTGERNWHHYSTTPTPSLKDIPVASVAAKDCALFMWTVGSHLPQAIALGEAWGFAYKTDAFVWVKSKKGGWAFPGMGYWTRKQTEPCLMFTRGSPKRRSKSVAQIIHCPRGAHSAKPEIQYDRIEALVGGPYLELFARNTRPGWSSWGNQVGIRDGLFDSLAPHPEGEPARGEDERA